MKPTLIFDTEVYRDYFLLKFLNANTGSERDFELYDGHPLDLVTIRKILRQYRLVSFNGKNFDLPLIALALTGADNTQLKKVANKIILNNVKHWQLGIDIPDVDHIDLIEVAPGIASLKIYGGRMHFAKMQDLPIDPEDSIAPEQRPLLREYCGNDCRTTLALSLKLDPQIHLREQMGEQYGIDLRSKSDAQIAEAVIRHEVEAITGRRLPKEDPFRLAGKSFKYRAPTFIESMPGGELAKALDVINAAEFQIGGNGVVTMPKEIGALKIRIGGSVYQMGIGGLHSTEKSTAHKSDDDHILVDRDVASYYPRIILNCGLKPANMGDHFTYVYNSIVERRLAAKHSGDKVTADSLKITINGSFGKFGSPYSILYSPTLLIQTTVTGQLSLLMLIETLESEGISVVSANTDGIVIRCPRGKVALMDFIVWEWELQTGFETEESRYEALYSRDVNNYVALKTKWDKESKCWVDGEVDGVKLKGVYAPAGLQKNACNEIVSDAVVAWLRDGVPPEQTIRNCRDITKFVTIRSVKGGAVWCGQLLGKAVRWYYSTDVHPEETINYRVNGYKVPRTEGAMPCMELPTEFPDNLDHQWYIDEVTSVLKNLGAL